MNIDDYPVNFGYGAKTTLNGKPYTHRGNDYPLSYQPVIIEGTQIGISGETGLVTGPHVHAQAGRDEWAQETIDPTPYVGKPGEVVKTGFGSEWGSYVCVKVGDVNVFYCHLSEISVHVGQKVGEEMPNEGDAINFIRKDRGNPKYDPSKQEIEDAMKISYKDWAYTLGTPNDGDAVNYVRADKNDPDYKPSDSEKYNAVQLSHKGWAYHFTTKINKDFKPLGKDVYVEQ